MLIQAHTTLSDLCSNSKRHSKRKWGEPRGVPFSFLPLPGVGVSGFFACWTPWTGSVTARRARALAAGSGWEDIRFPVSVGATVLVAQLHYGTAPWGLTKFGLSSYFLYPPRHPGYFTWYLNDRILCPQNGKNKSSFSSKFLIFSI